METVAQMCWVIRDVAEDGVTMEEQVDGEPTGRMAEFHRELLPEDVRAGDEFRVVAQIRRAEQRQGDDFFHPVFAEATEALSAARTRRQ